MKATFDLPDELVREVKIRAVMQGRPVKALVAELLRSALGQPAMDRKTQPRSTRIRIDDRGFPLIKGGPNAPAARMSIDQLLKLEQAALLEGDIANARVPC